MQHRWAPKNKLVGSNLHRISLRVAVFFLLVASTIVGISCVAGVPCPATGGDVPLGSNDQTEVIQSSDHWISIDGTSIKPGWSFREGVIHLAQRGSNQKELAGGHIITKVEYEDFDIEFDWKIERNGNSGLKYMVQRYGDRYLGIEYQLYDDDGDHKVEAKNSTGSVYDLFAPVDNKVLNPAGQWNRSRIVVQGGRIQHWLNGQAVVEVSMDDREWGDRVAASKFHDVPEFCKSRRGRIMLTDHGSDVWYRIISFRAGSLNRTR